MHFAILILLLVPGHVAEVQPEPEAGCLLQSAQGQLLALEAAQTNPTAASPLIAFVLWKLDPKHSMSTFYSARLTVLGSRPSTRPSSTRHTTQVSLATRRCALAAGPARNCGGRGKTDKIRTSWPLDPSMSLCLLYIVELCMAIHILEPWMEGIILCWSKVSFLCGTCPGWRSSFTRKVKKVPVDWQIIYTRYSAHQAFTKGVLLVDRSGGSARQLLEITSEDCRWRARKQGGEWTAVKWRNHFNSRQEGLFGRSLQKGCSKWTQACPSQSARAARQTRQSLAWAADLTTISTSSLWWSRRGFDSVCYRIPGCTRRTAWSPQPPQPHTGTIFWFASSKLCAIPTHVLLQFNWWIIFPASQEFW